MVVAVVGGGGGGAGGGPRTRRADVDGERRALLAPEGWRGSGASPQVRALPAAAAVALLRPLGHQGTAVEPVGDHLVHPKHLGVAGTMGAVRAAVAGQTLGREVPCGCASGGRGRGGTPGALGTNAEVHGGLAVGGGRGQRAGVGGHDGVGGQGVLGRRAAGRGRVGVGGTLEESALQLGVAGATAAAAAGSAAGGMVGGAGGGAGGGGGGALGGGGLLA